MESAINRPKSALDDDPPPWWIERLRDITHHIYRAAFEESDMPPKTRIKTEATPHPVPQTAEDVTEAIALIGVHQRDRDRIQAAMNDELAKVRERFEIEARPHAEAIDALSRGVHLYCEAHRKELTREGRVKTYAFASGEIKWRLRPPSVSIRGVETVIESLKARRLNRFVRTKEEINKDAILADPDAIDGVKGISIRQGEDFVVQPWETRLEEVL